MIYLINKLFIFVYKVKYKLFIRNYKLYSFKRSLEKTFKKNKEFSFIQVGANDGVSFDDLYDFVTKRKSFGVVIEPVKSYFEELKNNYVNFPNIVPVNMAVFHQKDVLDIYKINPEKSSNYPDWVKGIASFDKNHHKKTNIKEEDIIIEKVEADHLMSIIDTNFKAPQKSSASAKPQFIEIFPIAKKSTPLPKINKMGLLGQRVASKKTTPPKQKVIVTTSRKKGD